MFSSRCTQLISSPSARPGTESFLMTPARRSPSRHMSGVADGLYGVPLNSDHFFVRRPLLCGRAARGRPTRPGACSHHRRRGSTGWRRAPRPSALALRIGPNPVESADPPDPLPTLVRQERQRFAGLARMLPRLSGLEAVLVAAGTMVVLAYLLSLVAKPLFGFDAIALWLFKAKLYYGQQSVSLQAVSHDVG